ncbi:PilX N-terminal domain-containing pilus assembly protein [Amphritea sp.]|uniref:pilus assembly PilX family protein n=1 Tax=Amphritea sp. TaxID=1872502 RepID=UPI0025C1910F|nr:PilX N-terminal domain-containing pilus assembly protein [Amphritea sp.]
MTIRAQYFCNAQRGATLVVALILLLVMALMASTSLQSNVLQLRMAANMQDETVAFEAAETALLYSEKWLSEQGEMPDLIHYDDWHTTSREFVFDSSKSSLLKEKLAQLDSVSDWENKAQLVTLFDVNAAKPGRVDEPSRVTLEFRQYDADNKTVKGAYLGESGSGLFRQLSRNTGVTGNSEVILVSEYRKRFEY